MSTERRKEFAEVFHTHLKKLESRTGFLQYSKLKGHPDKLKELLTELVNVAVRFEANPQQLDKVIYDSILGAADKYKEEKFIGITARFVNQALQVWSSSNSKKGSAYEAYEAPVLTKEQEENVFGENGYFTQYLNNLKEIGRQPVKKETTTKYLGLESLSTNYQPPRDYRPAFEQSVKDMTDEFLERTYNSTNDEEWKRIIENEFEKRKQAE